MHCNVRLFLRNGNRFSSLNRIRIKNLAEKGNQRAALVLHLSENYDSLLSTILIGNNIVNIASASLATMIFVGPWEEAGPSVSTAVTTVVVLIFGEVSPKSIAKESPEAFALFSAPILRVFLVLLTPFNFLFGQWKKLLSHLFHAQEDRSITEEELLTIVDEVEQAGGIDQQEGTLIRSAIEFSELEARGCADSPRGHHRCLFGHSQGGNCKIFAQTAFSRIPVYQGTIDHILGILYQKISTTMSTTQIRRYPPSSAPPYILPRGS